MSLPPTFLATLFWILATLGVSAILIQQNLNALEHRQAMALSQAETTLNRRLQQCRRLLGEISRLTQGDRDELFSPALNRHLYGLLPLAPAVKRIQLQQRVVGDDIHAFEQQMRRRFPDFLLHGLSAMTPPTIEGRGVTVFHPMLLVVPDTPDVQPPLIGTDLGLIPELRSGLLRAHATGAMTHSQVYNQSRGDPLFNLFLATPVDNRILSLVIRLHRLLDSAPLTPGSRLSLTLDGQPAGEVNTAAVATPLWRTSLSRPLSSDLLNAELSLDYSPGWHDLASISLYISWLLNTLGALLLRAWLKQRQQTNSCQLESEQIQELKNDLQQRSATLQHQLQENQRLTHKILDIQERERRHLAQELHDELGQCLTAIRTDARMLLQDHPDREDSVNLHAESIDAVASHIYDVTYDLMHALRPTLLDDLGLVDAVRELIKSQHLERQGIRMELHLQGALNEMEERYNINLYRMIQEALTNLQRHAHCSQAGIRLQRFDVDTDQDRLELEIRDNGSGFDPQIISQKGRFGVLGLHTRAKALGGALEVDSAPGEGTRLLLRIPLAPAGDIDGATPSAAGSAAPRPSDADRRPASAGV